MYLKSNHVIFDSEASFNYNRLKQRNEQISIIVSEYSFCTFYSKLTIKVCDYMHKFSFTTVISCTFLLDTHACAHAVCVCYLYLNATVIVLIPFFPEGMPGMPDIFPLSGILGLSFDSCFQSPPLFFCLVLLCLGIFLLMVDSSNFFPSENSPYLSVRGLFVWLLWSILEMTVNMFSRLPAILH